MLNNRHRCSRSRGFLEVSISTTEACWERGGDRVWLSCKLILTHLVWTADGTAQDVIVDKGSENSSALLASK